MNLQAGAPRARLWKKEEEKKREKRFRGLHNFFSHVSYENRRMFDFQSGSDDLVQKLKNRPMQNAFSAKKTAIFMKIAPMAVVRQCDTSQCRIKGNLL